MNKRIKKIVLIGIALVLAASIYFGVGVFKDLQQLANTINPNRLTTFNYDEEPVIITVGAVQYKVPKAYLSSKLVAGFDGKISSFNIWASMNDDMVPWPISESFKKRDSSGAVRITISKGLGEPYHSEFPYNEINSSKKMGGGINRGDYRDIFTRYDATVVKEILPWGQGIEWYKENYYKKYKYTNTRFYLTGDGTITEETLHHFFLIPKGEDKYLIKCSAIGNPAYGNCRVTVLYTPLITYEFLIPHHIVEQFLIYDKQVQKLVERLIYHPIEGEKK